MEAGGKQVLWGGTQEGRPEGSTRYYLGTECTRYYLGTEFISR